MTQRRGPRTSHTPLSTLFSLLLPTLLLASALPLGLSADALLLKDGTAVEGTVTDKGSELEIATDHGTMWVDKSQIKKRFGPIADFVAQATRDQERSKAAFEEGTKLPDKDKRVVKAKEALKGLEAVRDAVLDAQEAFTSQNDAIRLQDFFKDVVHDIFACRYQVRDLETAAAPAAPAKAPAPAPVAAAPPPAAPKSDEPAVAALPAPVAPAAAKEPAPADAPDSVVAVLLKETKNLIAQGSVDAAYGKYMQVVREGGDAGTLRADLAKAFFDRGMKSKPAALGDIRRAFDLDRGTTQYYEGYMDACFNNGVESFKKRKWNECTSQCTLAIQAATVLIAKDDKNGKYLYTRGAAYQFRGIAETQKFAGKGGHAQILADYTKARADYQAVLDKDPNGSSAADAKTDLANVEAVLDQLSGRRPAAQPQPRRRGR